MTSGKKIQVLEKYRPFSFIFNVYNSENFHNPNKLYVIWNFLQACGFSVVLTSLSLIMVSAYRFCVDKSFDVSEISLAIPIIFCAFQQVLTYFSFMVKNRVIRQTVDQLQIVIEDRKYFFLNCNFYQGTGKIHMMILNSHSGCEISVKSLANYLELERMHTLITTIIFKTTMAITFIIFLTDALLPISYAIFKRPEPEYWISVLGFQ